MVAWSPTPRAALAVAIVAILTVTLPVAPELWLPAIAAVLLLCLADLSRVAAAPVVRREVRTSVVRGAAERLTVDVVGSAAAGRIRIRQPITPAMRLEPSEADGALDAELVVDVRGPHVLPPVVVRTVGPLGLIRRDHTCLEPLEVTAFPDLPGAKVMALARRQRSRDDGRGRGPLGLGTEFETVRDYSPDDDVRRINWKATVRLGRPMSNQYRVEQDREVLFLVDTGRLMGSPAGSGTRLDAALDALAAVAVEADAAGDRPGAIAFADTVRRRVATRRRGAEALVRALADLDALESDSDYELAFRAASEHKRALVLVMTDILDESASRTLADALPYLARRHSVMVAGIRDADVDAAVRTPPRQVVDVIGQGVALDLISSRERVAATVRNYGAVLVDQPPDELASACVAGYLTLKRRARL